jgi:hypothetical protein
MVLYFFGATFLISIAIFAVRRTRKRLNKPPSTH